MARPQITTTCFGTKCSTVTHRPELSLKAADRPRIEIQKANGWEVAIRYCFCFSFCHTITRIGHTSVCLRLHNPVTAYSIQSTQLSDTIFFDLIWSHVVKATISRSNQQKSNAVEAHSRNRCHRIPCSGRDTANDTMDSLGSANGRLRDILNTA